MIKNIMTSSIKIKQEPITRANEVPSSLLKRRAPPATSNASKQQRQAVHSSLINFSTEEASKLSYPVTCPVWYNFSAASENELNFCSGRVMSVAMDYTSRKLVYRIKADALGSNIEGFDLVSEDDIAYAINCKVRVTLGGTEQDGKIVCPSRVVTESGIIETSYSVVITNDKKTKVLHRINSQQIKYRPLPEQKEKDGLAERSVPIISSESETSRDSNRPPQLKWKPPSPNKRKTLAVCNSNSSSTYSQKKSRKADVASLSLTVPSWVLKAGNDLVGK